MAARQAIGTNSGRQQTESADHTAAHRESRETYSTRRVMQELAAQSHDVGRDRIERLRRELELCWKQRRKFVATTNSRHDLPVPENLPEQRFTPTRLSEIWVTHITHIPTVAGWLYLTDLKHVFSCEIVGYAIGERMTQDLRAQALWGAVANKRPVPGRSTMRIKEINIALTRTATWWRSLA